MKQPIITLLILCSSFISLDAQPVFSPKNMALGGGGSTYITNYNANFYNPANLMIQDRVGTFSFAVATGGFRLGAVQNYPSFENQFDNARIYVEPYKSGIPELTNFSHSEIIDDNYPGNTTLSDHTTRYDLTLIGLKWMSSSHSVSVAVRTRSSSTYRVGKGWHTNGYDELSGGSLLRNRSLIHRQQTLHEISIGYAESFEFLTRLTPRLDNFVIGIAPKLVLGGSYQNADWNNQYLRQPSGNINHVESFNYVAAGSFGEAANQYLNGVNLNVANEQAFNSDLFQINGYGAGLDIGVTYLLTLGSDLSAIRPELEPTKRSLRLSFSMTDIGFISYNNNEISVSSSADTSNNVSNPENLPQELFVGLKGQYLQYLENFGEHNPFLNASVADINSFSTLLPMAIHGGAMLEFNRLKMMGDVSVGLTNNAFNSTKVISAFGMEIRPLRFMPLRGGIQFIAARPHFLSIGTAIETRFWDLSLAAQFTPNSLISQPKITGVGAATLQFHF